VTVIYLFLLQSVLGIAKKTFESIHTIAYTERNKIYQVLGSHGQISGFTPSVSLYLAHNFFFSFYPDYHVMLMSYHLDCLIAPLLNYALGQCMQGI
jgi:hypothetical protein